MEFGEKNVLWPKYIDIYNFRGGGVHVLDTFYIFCLLFNEKVQDYDLLYTKIKFYIILI